MNVAIIPARGGSKRIPRKNIRDFFGKPMIAYSIEAAKRANCFDRIVVSTDDHEIAEIAENYGAEVPFIRPVNLSDDVTGTIPVVKHAIDMLEGDSNSINLVCCVYATAPFIYYQDLITGHHLMMTKACDYAFSVTSYAFPIQRALKINADQRVEMFSPEFFNKRSQDLEEAFHDAGQFYWGTKKAWLDEKVIFSSKSFPIILPRYRVQDIDTLEDWECAEIMFESIMSRDIK